MHGSNILFKGSVLIITCAGLLGSTAPNALGDFLSVELPTGNVPFGVAIGDLNQDGLEDLAVIDAADNTASVFLGTGDGTQFEPRRIFGLKPNYFPCAVAIGDLNSDGKPDLAIPIGGSFFSYLSILHGNGKGSFGDRTDIKVDPGAVAVAIADLNADGLADVVTANCGQIPNGAGTPGANTISVLLARRNGQLSRPMSFATAQNPGSVAAGDLNGDGRTDLVTVSQAYQSPISILLGNGDGTFATASIYPVVSFLGTGFSVAIADLNLDGRPDLVTDGATLLGNGDGSFGSVLVNYDAGGMVKSADFNGDAKPDVVAAGYGEVRLMLGNGDGTLASPIAIASGGGGAFSGFMAVGDVDGDGPPDVAVTKPGFVNTVAVLLNRGVPSAALSSESLAVPQTERFRGPAMSRVSPNPLISEATLVFQASQPGLASVKLFDLNGRLVRILLDGVVSKPGEQRVRIDGRDDSGRRLAPGVYFYRIEMDEGVAEGRVAIIK